tara:strand:+ start:349 stop:540 length:192 start_codon:yes stop_codon:yes gene_type:complete
MKIIDTFKKQMVQKLNKTFFIWILLVILWNFGFPGAEPVYDVLVAIGLAFFAKFIEEKIRDKS